MEVIGNLGKGDLGGLAYLKKEWKERKRRRPLRITLQALFAVNGAITEGVDGAERVLCKTGTSV